MQRMVKQVRRAVWLVLAGTLAWAPAAESQQVPGDTLQVHTVREGDTLWDLARRYLTDPFRWPDIFQLNRSVVANPHLIYPADQLRIPLRYIAQPGVATAQAPGMPMPADATATSADLVDRTVFYQPAAEAAAAEHRLRLAESVPAAPVSRGDYLRAGVLAQELEIAPLGHLVEIVSPTVVPLEMAPQIQLFDKVYMTLADSSSAVAVGDRLQLVRVGRRVGPYGRLHETTGVARVEALNGGVATVMVEEMFNVVAVGDLALPMPVFEPRVGVLAEAASGLEGQIIGFQSVHAVHNIEDVAYIDLGEASGVKEGDEFVVMIPEQRRSWGTRPAIGVGRLRVVRAAETTSAARVIALEQPALEAGLRVQLVARMP